MQLQEETRLHVTAVICIKKSQSPNLAFNPVLQTTWQTQGPGSWNCHFLLKSKPNTFDLLPGFIQYSRNSGMQNQVIIYQKGSRCLWSPFVFSLAAELERVPGAGRSMPALPSAPLPAQLCHGLWGEPKPDPWNVLGKQKQTLHNLCCF